MQQDIQVRWKQLTETLKAQFKKDMTVESILFLIGVRELGASARDFSKEEKVDLMHIAICRIFSASGYYKLVGHDQEGWPHWENVQSLPHTDIFSQEYLLKEHILHYFESEGLFSNR